MLMITIIIIACLILLSLMNNRNFQITETFPDESFKGDLSNALGSSGDSFHEFDHLFITKLNKYALLQWEIVSLILIVIYVEP